MAEEREREGARERDREMVAITSVKLFEKTWEFNTKFWLGY